MMYYWWIIGLSVAAFGIILYARKNESRLIKSDGLMDIIERQYVEGKISKVEYEKQKQLLNSKQKR